jgi:hypothetical protein
MKKHFNKDWADTTCMGKQSFDSSSMANKVAKLSAGRKSSPMNAYKCTVCGKYHIGNRVGKSKAFNQRPRHLDRDSEQLGWSEA